MFSKFHILYAYFGSILWLTLSCNSHNTANNTHKIVPSTIEKRWDSVPYLMKNVNAYYMAYIPPDGDGEVLEKYNGENVTGRKVDKYTIFEGASLSKTVFAYLYWRLRWEGKLKDEDVTANVCGTNILTHVKPQRLLSHTVACGDDCIKKVKPDNEFAYSENGYLLLQKYVERATGKNLEQLAQEEVFKPLGMTHSTFVWNDSFSNYVNGFQQDNTPHREIYKFKHPQSNGTLYTTGHDMTLFVRALTRGPEHEYMNSKEISVKGFRYLYWAPGFGLEENLGCPHYWQWGSNWCYNNIIIINGKDYSSLICLTNSIIGAKRLKQSTNYLLNRQFQLFDYINWY